MNVKSSKTEFHCVERRLSTNIPDISDITHTLAAVHILKISHEQPILCGPIDRELGRGPRTNNFKKSRHTKFDV